MITPRFQRTERTSQYLGFHPYLGTTYRPSTWLSSTCTRTLRWRCWICDTGSNHRFRKLRVPVSGGGGDWRAACGRSNPPAGRGQQLAAQLGHDRPPTAPPHEHAARRPRTGASPEARSGGGSHSSARADVVRGCSWGRCRCVWACSGSSKTSMRASPIELRHRRVDHAAYRQCRSVGNFARGPKRAIVGCAARTRDGQGAGIRTVRSHRSTAARGRMREKRFASASERALTVGGITAHEIRLWGRVSGSWTSRGRKGFHVPVHARRSRSCRRICCIQIQQGMLRYNTVGESKCCVRKSCAGWIRTRRLGGSRIQELTT